MKNWFAILAVWICAGGTLFAAAPGLTADEIIRRAVAEAKWVEEQDIWDQFGFDRHTVVKEFDKGGNLKELKEIWVEINEKSSRPRLKQMKINGEPLSGAKLRAELDEQAKNSKSLAKKGARPKRDASELALTEEVVRRYHFVLLDKEKINGREAYVVSFRPRSDDLPVKELVDRVLNQIYGRLWVDAEDFEVARAEIRLQSEVKLWAGILAALRKFTFTVERVRLGDRVWFNQTAVGDFEGRKLLDSTHIWMEAVSTNYHRINRPVGGVLGEVAPSSR